MIDDSKKTLHAKPSPTLLSQIHSQQKQFILYVSLYIKLLQISTRTSRILILYRSKPREKYMDVLLRQTRARFPGLGQENKEETGSNRERRIPPQKTQSFKGEKKRSQNWFSRQLSRQMSQDDGDDEYAMAVAAAAFAINSTMEELTISNTNQRKPRERQDSITHPLQPANKVSPRISGDFSRAEEPTRNVGQAPSLKRGPTFQDKKSPSVQSPKPQSRDLKPNPPITKQFTFPDKNKPGSANPPLTKQLTFPAPEIRKSGSIRAKAEETEADKWEKAEMIKINERYARMKTTILNWENKKKGKARNKKERNESELERKRSTAMQKYREEIDRIEKIAGRARTQADKNERSENLKAKVKANKIRETGRLPATCLCF